MLKVVCINGGNYEGQGVRYVNTLHDMVRRNLPAGFGGEFICYTDYTTADYHLDIMVRQLPGYGLVDGWWNKLALFRQGLFDPGDRIVYFDLDTLIIGRLDEIVAYDGQFAVLRDFFDPNGLQSSVMMWQYGFGEKIWNEYVMLGCPDLPGGDQAWIRKHVNKPDILQKLYPGAFVSYKVIGGKIPDASVVVFHGKPRPHEVVDGWVPQVWKVGGLVRADLDAICNTSQAKLLDNVRINSARKLPWIHSETRTDQHVVIVGGGPSVESKVDEIKWRAGLGQEIWALNGAAKWLRSKGIKVEAHVIVDARPDNVRFVRSVHGADPTTYHFIASQCDPSVFEALKGKRVMIWHSNALGVSEYLAAIPGDVVPLIGGGSTVGLSAMVIASVLGARYIHLYGYDSSVTPDAHHVYPQLENQNDLIVDVLVDGGTHFRATPWMVQQANEFNPLCAELLDRGVEVITVAGEGLLPYLAKHYAPPITAADIRAHEILSRLPEGRVRGAEIGVFAGVLSMRLLARPDLELIMVDAWDSELMIDKEDFHASLTSEQQEQFMRLAQDRVAFAGARARIFRELSIDALYEDDIPDGSLDFVFIDADHHETAVFADIAGWLRKLKPGGLLCGHDYNNTDYPHFGVKEAVDEFIATTGFNLELGDNFCWFVRLPEVPEAARIAAE